MAASLVQARAGLFTGCDLAEESVARTLFEQLDGSIMHANRFGSTEEPEFRFAPDAAPTAAQLFRRRGLLFVTGVAPDYIAMFTDLGGFSEWDIWFHSDDPSWLDWILALCDVLPVLYGYGCSELEWEAKHADPTILPNGASLIGSVGVSTAEFRSFLPGIYWLTIFGPELVDHFGAERLASLRGTIPHRLKYDQIALQLDEPLTPGTIAQHLAREREIANELGARYFFDRDRPHETYASVPGLTARLRASQEGTR